MLETFHFLRPLWLVALPALALLWWTLRRREDPAANWRRIIAPHLLDHLLVGRSQRAVFRPVNLLAVLWTLAVIALAGPSWRREPSPFAEDAAVMMVLLKVTPSMLAEDLPPNRLDRARQKLRDLLERRRGAATGLIAYRGSAHLVLPPTRDGRILETMAAGLLPETMPVEGDVLSKAIALAERILADADSAGSVLVLADSVSEGGAVAGNNPERTPRVPVQFLALQALGAETDSGLRAAARALKARVTAVTVDAADVEAIAAHAKREVQAVQAAQSGERWQDAGYTLVPLIAALALLWGRRGWTVA